jgi:hypothetical protein
MQSDVLSVELRSHRLIKVLSKKKRVVAKKKIPVIASDQARFVVRKSPRTRDEIYAYNKRLDAINAAYDIDCANRRMKNGSN